MSRLKKEIEENGMRVITYLNSENSLCFEVWANKEIKTLQDSQDYWTFTRGELKGLIDVSPAHIFREQREWARFLLVKRKYIYKLLALRDNRYVCYQIAK